MEATEIKNGFTQMGYYRMYFRSGWYGKWFPQDASFKEVRTAESEVLKGFCKWIEQTFKGGCDDEMISYLETNTNNGLKKNPNGRFRASLDIDDNSYAEVEYSPEFRNNDYPIRIYLFRRNG